MREYTNFSDFYEFLDKSNWGINSKEDFKNIPKEKFDQYVDKNIEFKTWKEMLHKAAQEYVKRKIKEI